MGHGIWERGRSATASGTRGPGEARNGGDAATVFFNSFGIVITNLSNKLMAAKFWAKTGAGKLRGEGSPEYHPVICHLADTAAVAMAQLDY